MVTAMTKIISDGMGKLGNNVRRMAENPADHYSTPRPSWPDLSRRSALRRWCADVGDKPGHDGKTGRRVNSPAIGQRRAITSVMPA
jgi:hypothetical protein